MKRFAYLREKRYVKLERHGKLNRCTRRYAARITQGISFARHMNRKDTEDVTIPGVFILVTFTSYKLYYPERKEEGLI
jgi:hypothetical protein